ncbi:MarR family transcriptional regulator [Micrococcus sp. EYE_162]|uniref:MarR family winged helix-turn-helix transcriptional regulator n=1 Tax=unclassified Micrococcus TaxID=2620948 RepID=UPI0020037DD3|nr:MarR family transcriptional regulator [Micrococcus sp. M4NT]MCK6095345.1 MarR family transcriptional regulator [Micrococcus sp. EYE_212]MCK6171383.1 MarR family transcriptional regulator [Micrococcus sp. EYE_162]MDX2340698.1 MarR family transcriptional regulator [Micrococcus sp. M4NT]
MTTPAADRPEQPLALLASLRAFSEVADRAADQASRALGLHRTDLRALSILMRRTSRGLATTPTDLGHGLHLTRAATTSVIDRLVASGHARRARSATDGRRVIVEPTPAASADGSAAFGPMARRIAAALEGFDDAELATALRVVDAATRSIAPLAEDGP